MARSQLRVELGHGATDFSRLSDAELIAQLSDTAKELGIEINLNYSFAQQPSATETDASAINCYFLNVFA